MKKIVIAGAGATGLVLAYLFARRGVKVTLLEAAPQAGGLLHTFDVGQGARLEHFYHHFFTHDAEIAWLLKEIGLAEQVIFQKTSMGMMRDGKIYPFNGALDLLRFKPMSFLARLRFAASSLLLSHRDTYTEQETKSALDWFYRFAGRGATEAIWRPMLKIKFGDQASQVPLAWMAGRLRQRARSRKQGAEQLGYLQGSSQVLVDRLLKVLGEMGVEIRLNSPIQSLVVEQ